MNEVMRWKLKGFIPGVEGISKALYQPWVVPAEDFDRLSAEHDALQQQLTEANQRIGDLLAEIATVRLGPCKMITGDELS